MIQILFSCYLLWFEMLLIGKLIYLHQCICLFFRSDQLKHFLQKDFPQLIFHAPKKKNVSEKVYMYRICQLLIFYRLVLHPLWPGKVNVLKQANLWWDRLMKIRIKWFHWIGLQLLKIWCLKLQRQWYQSCYLTWYPGLLEKFYCYARIL